MSPSSFLLPPARYRGGHLLEINAHSLFSKWFSESGKLVMKLFAFIQELVADGDSLICVLIDEVESLTAARAAAAAGTCVSLPT
jgi:SpoVK/Ycf46/Vps4 family AAA+-type ATPase